MDLLDDIFSEPSTVKGPIRAKFQPKAKSRPQKGPSVGSTRAALAAKEQAVPSAPAKLDSSQLLQANDFVNKNLDLANSSSIVTAATEKTIPSGEDILTRANLAAEVGDFVGSVVAAHPEAVLSKTSGDWHWIAGASLGSQGSKDAQDLGSQSAKDSVDQSTKEDLQILDASATQAAEDTTGFRNVSFASTSPFRPCNGNGISKPSTSQESGHTEETLVGSAGDFQIDMEQETVDFSFLETVDITSDGVIPSGTRAVKFQPKPRARNTQKTNIAVVFSHLPDATKISSENQHINVDGLIHAGETLTVSDLSLLGLDDDSGTDPTIVQHDNADSMVAPDFSKERGNNEKRMASDMVASSYGSLVGEAVSLGAEATEDGHGYLDGANEDIQLNNSSPPRAINEEAANGGECNGHLLQEETLKKRLMNSEKVSPENDTPNRKRRKEARAPEESTKKHRKKFPHTTRRKRSVDKSLLDAPDDEIDLRTVPIRDLIILAGYKERQVHKQAAVVQPPSTSERGESTLQEDLTYNEDEAYGSDQDKDSVDNLSTSRVVPDTGCFNYQSFMNRKPKRWSKHETELFYQGLQEFGSDFTMIQQRYFPDRSRHQIKLKYKKEEREHPMRIHDALTSRAKDLSHFEVLIQKLQEREQAAQEKAEQSDDDNLVGSAGEEDEDRVGEALETHAASQGAAKHDEQSGGSAVPNRGPDDTARVESPAKSCDSEEEFDWNEYKSEL